MIGKRKAFCLCMVATLAALAYTGCGNEKQVQNEQSYRQIGLNQIAEGNYESAIVAFDKALNEHVGQVTNLEEDINFYKAYAQMECGKVQDAIDTYTALVSYNKKNAEAYYLRGKAYMSIQNEELAVEDFQSAINYNKDSGELYAGIYEQLLSAGLVDEAASYLEEGLKIKGDSAGACLSRGRLYLASAVYDKAESELSNALAKKEYKANLYLGDAAVAQGKNEEARAYYEAYVDKYTDDSRVYYALGSLEFQDESYEQALSYFKQGLSCKNIVNKSQLWSGKIAALEHMGDFKSARQEMEGYLEDYPEDEEAQREFVFLKTR